MNPLPTLHLPLGSSVLQGADEQDFVLDDAFPLTWQRTYASYGQRDGLLGAGWTLPISFALEIAADRLIFIDLQSRRTQFPALEIGEQFYSRCQCHRLLQYFGLSAPRTLPALTATPGNASITQIIRPSPNRFSPY